MKKLLSKHLPPLFHIKNGNIIDPFKEKEFVGDILIKNGKIIEIGEKIEVSDEVAVCDVQGLVVTHGFCDIHAHFREPGREDKETLTTGSQAALAGGFTTVCVMPNTDPPLDSPESIRFICEKATDLPINILPIGTITKGMKGRELSEMSAMFEEGAVAFSDDGLPLVDGGVLRRALEYSSRIGVPIINHAEDPTLKLTGQMHEGRWSTKLGLIGIPYVSESIMVSRDIQIAGFTGGRLHVPHVSSEKSVECIRNAKDEKWLVTAEVTPHNLYFTDSDLEGYNTYLKVAPPIRTDEDRQALINGLKDGVIDCIATDHAPHTVEEKELPFNWAPNGMIGLETAFGASWYVLFENKIPLRNVIELFTINPRRILGFELDLFRYGVEAALVILDVEKKWVFNEDHIYSKSRNSAFIGKELLGYPVGVISTNRFYSSDETFFSKYMT